MGQIRLPGNPPIDVVVRRSARARRLSLRMSQLDGRVTLTLPNKVPESQGVAFLREKEAWLRGHLSQRAADVPIGLGASIPVEGDLLRIEPGQGRSVRRSEDALYVPGDPARVPAKLKGWLRTLARDRLAEACDEYAHRLGRPYARLTLRDTRSRWGSCTHDGGLMFSWRLILADREILDYVAAHEVAHLAEMNHSPAFWAQVERIYGDWKPARNWLRDNGSALHRYKFE
ncbi:SprT family zinc-dependent metalloprotease [uncultured Pelagimonas sp.]|uniref:M48 family metallopeptidase n=1 Tax=uncultured Pelagimonas sp. TaxID=1618102 RepID=UPI00262376C0|nr:SprT family zinc-dependent metalloprotease [uncultured Pelagimonas sp.]